MSREKIARIIVHLLLAVFTASAANKFFVRELEAEAAFGDYARIFEFRGDAPDQYRILPLLGLKMLCMKLPFNHAVLLFNLVFSFLCLEIFFRLLKPARPEARMAFSLVFSILFIYTQYTGWRPDTLALLFLCGLASLWAIQKPPGWKGFAGMVLLLTCIAFSRTDIALAYGIFFSFHTYKAFPQRLVLLAIAPAVQILLQFLLFPGAEYYTKIFMLEDNLKGFYLVMNPATWLILAGILAFRKDIFAAIRLTFQKSSYFYFVFTGYFALVLMVGRINEYRLYLPFIPIFLLVLLHENGKKKAGHI